MKPDLNDLAAFARVAHHGSFRRAAQELQVSASALSHTMRKLELALATRLLNRTTRSVSLSPAGALLLARLNPALLEINAALDALNTLRDSPSGRIRLNVPRPAAQLLIAPRLAAWRAQYPAIELEIVSSDDLVDIVAQGFDAGIRFGHSLQQDMVAVAIGTPMQFSACAAPAYLQQFGTPRLPQDLLAHQCIQLRFPSGAHYRWEFEQAEQKVEVTTTGSLVFDDFTLIMQAAIDGAGICYTYDQYAAPLVAAGKLAYVLPDWRAAAEHFYLYYPSGRNLPASLRALIDFLK